MQQMRIVTAAELWPHTNHLLSAYLTYFECQGSWYSATLNEVVTLAVDGWAVTFGAASRGLGGADKREIWHGGADLWYCCIMVCCSAALTLYGHIKSAEQRTSIQQYGDWYTGQVQSPPRCTKCDSPPING